MFRLTTRGAWPTAGAVPSEPDLATLFPATLEDQPLVVRTHSGPEWMAGLDAADTTDAELMNRTQDLISFYAGTTLDDLTMATTVHEVRSGETVTIMAIRIRGTFASDYPASLLLISQRLVLFSYSDDESYLDVLAGRIVDRPVDEFDPDADPVAVYRPLGDTSWLIDAQEPLLSEVMAALPPPGGRLEVPQLGIAVTWSDEWPVEIVARMIDRNGLFGELLGPDDTVWEIA